MSFWGVYLKPNEPYTLLHNQNHHKKILRITQATLGDAIRTSPARSTVNCCIGDKPEIAICSLIVPNLTCCQLDLEFHESHDVIFSVKGPRGIHLAGYFVTPAADHLHIINDGKEVPNGDEVQEKTQCGLLQENGDAIVTKKKKRNKKNKKKKASTIEPTASGYVSDTESEIGYVNAVEDDKFGSESRTKENGSTNALERGEDKEDEKKNRKRKASTIVPTASGRRFVLALTFDFLLPTDYVFFSKFFLGRYMSHDKNPSMGDMNRDSPSLTIEGQLPEISQTILVECHIQGQSVTILVDCGSTHNIIQPRIASLLSTTPTQIRPFPVMVGSGHFLERNSLISSIPLEINKTKFNVPMFIITVAGADVILGLSWLSSLGTITADFAIPQISFMVNGKPCVLRGEPLSAPINPSSLNSLIKKNSVELESDVSNEEIKRAVWDCGIDKSPGPDGFTFGFYRRFWNLIENDVYDAVKYFFTYGVIPKGCNSSFIALIPKIPDANTVKDFRPISLIGSLYKIVAKILANRLVGVLGDIVNEVQSAF
nr:RNA-directed DNA polymerase, eukaryota, reverse transcriptase zinc-binding domain protein [Tanacetum cinerariifolium]